jgi:hypothetical protein
MFYPKDNMIYDELWDVVPAALVTKGQAALVQDVFGFYYVATKTVGDEVAFIYRQRQVESCKATGTGEDINAGERLYYIVANDNVSPNIPAGGVLGTDYYFCGWAKKSATASATRVLKNQVKMDLLFLMSKMLICYRLVLLRL